MKLLQHMTDQEINVAIAEACGWRISLRWQYTQYGRVEYGSRPASDCVAAYVKEGRTERAETLPSYCTDLNAMHEALTMCLRSLGQMEKYKENLRMVLIKHNAVEIDVTACALHCAEAFLRTIGKWKS